MGRWLVVSVASLAAILALAASEPPVSRTIVYRPTARVSGVDGDLRAERRVLASAGYRLARHERVEGSRVRIREEVPLGECVAVLAGASDRWRVEKIEWVARDGGREHTTEKEERTTPYRRTLLSHVCPMRASRLLRDRALVAFDVGVVRAGEGSAEVYVFRGPPHTAIGGDGPPIEGDRAVIEEVDTVPALVAAMSVLFALLVIGLMVEATIHDRRIERERERTLRRFTIALPAGLRGELQALAETARSPGGARALRDRLSALAPLTHAAVFSRWRADADEIDARYDALLTELASRRASGRQSTYRSGADGLTVLTILIRHRCDLPELPTRIDALSLSLALDSSLPRDDRELVGVDVLFHPRDRSESLDPTQLAACFPELVPLDAATTRCSACEAPVAHPKTSCSACGASVATGG